MKQQTSKDISRLWQTQATDKKTDLSGLALALERLKTSFGNRIGTDDREILSFCLQHLFYSIDALYQVTLPELTTGEEQEQQNNPRQRYRTWIFLRETKRLLERTDLLCRLLNSSATSMLDTLDMTTATPTFEQSEIDESDPDYAQFWSEALAQEQWEQAFTLLTRHLHAWQESHEKLQPFSSHFPSLITTIPTLPQANAALSLLLASAESIFSTNLADLRKISTSDDEAIAVVLLDLMQKADQGSVQVGLLIDPLSSLIKHYAMDVGEA